MPRSKDGVKRAKVNIDSLTNAVNAVLNENMATRAAAKLFSVSRTTLQNHLKKKQDDQPFVYKNNCDNLKVFSVEHEEMLCNYLITCSKMLYGVSIKEARKLAYNFANCNNITCPASWDRRGLAGKTWYYGFMSRHNNMSLRKPQATSLSRATSFNKHNVSSFFNKYKELLNKYHFAAENIYNVDESGISTVHTPSKIIAVKGTKQVGSMTSGERGVNTTIIGCINAIGNTIPPAMIFARVHFKEHMLKGAPAGILGMAHVSGWSNSEKFLEFLKHFIKHAKPSQDNKVLLLMDNHESHISIQAIDLAKRSGVVMFTFPPHTSHKLQPLDRGVFGPFKKFYNAAATEWLQSHPGKPLTIYDVAEIVGQAYPRAFSPINIQAGFKTSGIWPVNQHVFGEDEYLSSSVTDRVPTNDSLQDMDNVTETSRNLPENIVQDLPSTSASSSSLIAFRSPEIIRPFPKAGPRLVSGRGRRKPGRSRVLTETPEKQEIEKEHEKRLVRKRERVQNVTRKIVEESSTSSSDEEIGGLKGSDSNELDWPPIVDTDEENDAHNANEKIVKGDFWLTKLDGKKKTHYYLAEVVDSEKEEFTVKYLKKVKGAGNKFVYENQKTYEVLERDFIVKLPKPTSVGGSARQALQLTFSINFDTYHIE